VRIYLEEAAFFTYENLYHSMLKDVCSGLGPSRQHDMTSSTKLGKNVRTSTPFFCMSVTAEINQMTTLYRIWFKLEQMGWEEEIENMPRFHNEHTSGLVLFEELPCVKVPKPLTDRGYILFTFLTFNRSLNH
jgi:hypothetical protein